ncbi:MAG TPA: NAD(P)-dependent oxidoreductase [Chloroflexota bacterium]|jgi:nucleoside-diphosphate-sugar epimerase|nr:NAD(P)-dependent oxidoreductase [Chloroflexota bacterium]
MKVLVTGGAGLIGSYVCQELVQHGHTVVSFDRERPRLPPAERTPGIVYRIGDHEDLGQVVEVAAGVDAIAHLSAIPAPRTHPNATVFRTNVMGTFNVHEAAVIAGVPLVVSTSSQSAYGFAWQHRPFLPQYLPLDEAHPDLSQDAYGLSKMVGETIAHGFHRRCDLRVCLIRPPWVILPEWYESMLRQALTNPTRDPNGWSGNLYSYVDVRDLALAFRLALEAPPDVVQDEVYNVAADDALATEPLAQLLPRLDPAFRELAAGLTGSQSMVSAARIKQALGWRPRYSWRDILSL